MQQDAHIQDWRDRLDEREQRHVAFCREYAEHFAHGVTGHHDYLLIAKLTQALEDMSRAVLGASRVHLLSYNKDTGGWRDLMTGVLIAPDQFADMANGGRE